MALEIVGDCWHCGKALNSADYGRENNCLGCNKPTRVCRNCRWYDTRQSNACEEPMAERVMEKERANYCDYFEPTRQDTVEGGGDQVDLQRQAAEDLFSL
ncbi:MAG: hypothetical protein GY934_06025 [Gammaproteobacteria bacterium]|nr:hypothetical protein [Gammaproteobacteria bacterium]